MKNLRQYGSAIAFLLLTSILFFASPFPAPAAGESVNVQFDIAKAGPRAIEPLTEARVLRDYRAAWSSLAWAEQSNTLDPLEGPFVASAKKWLSETISHQRQSGLSTHYSEQSHNLQAVFYAPEGDVIELHDTAQFHVQVFDGSKVIRDEPVTEHYVVLMTPGADRWVIRQLQSVAHF